MSQLQFSTLLAFGVVGLAVVIIRGGDSSEVPRSGEASLEIEKLRGEVGEMSSTLANMVEEMRELRILQAQAATTAPRLAVATQVSEDGGSATPAAISTADLKGTVAAILEQERIVQEQERETQREEMRQRMEERRNEVAAMREGPWDRYNLRVNSMGKVLGMDDAQKQAYFELTAAYRTKVEEGMKALREKREAESTANGENNEEQEGRRRGGFRRGGGEEFRQLYSDAQEQFSAEMQRLLSAEQLETYSSLSRDAQSFRGDDMVSANGDRGGFGSRFGGGGGRRGGRGR